MTTKGIIILVLTAVILAGIVGWLLRGLQKQVPVVRYIPISVNVDSLSHLLALSQSKTAKYDEILRRYQKVSSRVRALEDSLAAYREIDIDADFQYPEIESTVTGRATVEIQNPEWPNTFERLEGTFAVDMRAAYYPQPFDVFDISIRKLSLRANLPRFVETQIIHESGFAPFWAATGVVYGAGMPGMQLSFAHRNWIISVQQIYKRGWSVSLNYAFPLF